MWANISGGDVEGSSSHTLQQKCPFKGNHQDQFLKVRSVWSRDHPFELIIGDPEAGVRD